MATIGDLVVNLGLNRQGYARGLKGARGQTTSFVSGLKSIIAPVAGLLAGAAAGFAAGKSVNAAREQLKSERQLAAVIKATGGAAGLTAKEIQQYAGDLQKLTNFSDEATISAAGMLATFKGIKGDQFKETLASAQDLSSVMGTDLKSSVLQLGKALNDPTTGLSALSRSGVTFTADQKELIKTLQESGDLMGAQKVILAELQSQFGGSAQAMADPLIQAKNIMGDVAELLGFALLPGLEEMVEAFTGAAGPLTENRALFESIGRSIGDIVRVGIQPLRNAFVTMVGFMQRGSEVVAFALKTGFRNAADLAQLAMIDISLAVFGLVPGVADVMETVAGFFVAGWDASAAAGMAFVQNIIGGFKELLNVGEAVVTAIARAFDALVSGGNPLEAFTEGFIETLANQTDVESSGNPLAVFKETFERTRANVKIGFDESSLVDSLKAQREQIASSIGLKTFAKDIVEGAKVTAALAAGGGADIADGKSGVTAELKANKALEINSSAGFDAAITALSGTGRDVQDKQLDELKAIAADSQFTADKMAGVEQVLNERLKETETRRLS